ncbi:AMP-dependent synthetase/ligase [Saccharomonospora iraqiensis]|uniref:AMP-dependent synthetase/ligase n=1 Tax=Saccharomonospora iraqiensis TaxID=52698 RepID=UPI00022DF4E5|nr:AMP-dependent synthetase/ligase [Saccharomonospora iraqiensis]
MITAEQVHRGADGCTVGGLLRRNAERHADRPALSTGTGEAGTTVTWAQLYERVAAAMHGLSAAGLRHGDRMLIDVSSRPEHWVVDHAAVHLGAIPCTAYQSLSTDQIRHVATHSAATVVVLEGADQLARWRPVLDTLTTLRSIVLIDDATLDGAGPDTARFRGDHRLASYSDLLAGGAELHRADPDAVRRAGDERSPDDPVTMIYTSGTTGDPKGVVLTHRNVFHQAAAQELVQPGPPHPRQVAYLPLAHVAERVLSMYLPLFNAGHVTVCPDPAQLAPTLREVRPHGFFGVPRVWEKFAAAVQGALAALPEERRAAVEAARDTATRVYALRARGAEPDADLAAEFDRVDRTVLRELREQLGLAEAVRLGSGAAPIPAEVLEFFGGLGLPIMEVWGLSETTGAATTNFPDGYRPGTVGLPTPGMEIRTADDGEVLVRGPLVFAGYLDTDGRVVPDVDERGWLATGDVGTLDDDGYLTITDRKKELLITAGGKNVAPSRAEGLLRRHPLIGHAAVIGDRRPYVTALVTLDEESAPAWAAARGLEADDVAALASDPTVLAEVADAVRAANTELSRPEQIKAHRVLGGVWTPETGELTPTMKLKRRVIEHNHADEIAALYADDAP